MAPSLPHACDISSRLSTGDRAIGEDGCHIRPLAEATLDVIDVIDATTLRSSMTLLEQAAPDAACFGQVLDRFFGGARDEATIRILGRLS